MSLPIVSEIVLLQTADAEQYLPLLEATAAVNRLYCERQNIKYSHFIGVKRGFFPWQACFNRIILLKEMIEEGFTCWVFYLDADAFVVDLSFDLRSLISDIAKPIIMAPGGLSGQPWDVNDGVFVIDLSNDTARDLILAWHSDFMSTSDEALLAAPEWHMVESDQPRLQRILRENECFGSCVGMADRYLLNDHKSSFVRQILRSNAATWQERLMRVRKETADVLQGGWSANLSSTTLWTGDTRSQRGGKRSMDTSAISEKVREYFWFHSIDLGNGTVTPGKKSPEIHAAEAAAFFDPIEIKGATVIDIGAWNGFYSFEAKRRGASRVLATDHFCWNHEQFRGRETFELARSALGLDIEILDIDVTELCPDKVGMFDVVLFLGVLYHLFDPIDGLRRAASLAKDVLVVETCTDLGDLDRPAMVMYPGRELDNDPTNWWGPNNACVRELLKTMGFVRIDGPEAFSRRAVFHAWRVLPRARR
jgi:tRNA (mo5U34)-methyltransferase